LSLKNDEVERVLVERNIKVVNDRYQMPVPVKQDIVDNLLDNYQYVLKCTESLRTNALKNQLLQCMLKQTFNELINEG